MEPAATGALIRALRKEAGLTQRELAQRLCVTDKAVSKWERGMGCPDVSLLRALSDVFRVDMAILLSGALPQSRAEGGNMKRTGFYLCPECGNLMTASAKADISCCGRRLERSKPVKPDEAHMPHLEKMDDEYCITFTHPMTKEHHLRFLAWLNDERMLMIRLYPEQDALVRIPQVYRGTLVFGCTQDGLMSVNVRDLL